HGLKRLRTAQGREFHRIIFHQAIDDTVSTGSDYPDAVIDGVSDVEIMQGVKGDPLRLAELRRCCWAAIAEDADRAGPGNGGDNLLGVAAPGDARNCHGLK